MTETLTTLLSRAKNADEADADLLGLVGVELGLHENAEWWARFERFLKAEAWESAALALVEAKLPGWSWVIGTEEHKENGFFAELWRAWGPHAYKRTAARCCKTLPLAIIDALLTAILEKYDAREG